MTTQPGETSRESSLFLTFEDLGPVDASSAEDYCSERSSAEGSGDGPKGRRRSPQVIVLLTDAAVLVLSLGHLALTIVLMCYNGRPVDASYNTLQSILTTIGPIFPMVFAFIVSRFLYHAARYRLENGASLGALEQLMGSRTVGSAVATHFELRAFNMLGVLILFIWVFSPLGGQSFLRVLDIAYPPTNTSLFYMNTLKTRLAFHDDIFKDSSYASAFHLSDSGRPGPRDLWGNIKIPLLDVDNKSDVWHEIDHDTAHYSAFIGLPIRNVSVGNSTFYLESNYLQLNCDPITSHILDKNKSTDSFSEVETPISELELEFAKSIPSVFGENRTYPFVNGSWYGFQHARSQRVWWNIAINRFVDKCWSIAFRMRHFSNKNKYDLYNLPSMGVFENETAIEAGPTYLLFQARRNLTRFNYATQSVQVVSIEVQKAKCLVLQKYVESRVACSRASHESLTDCIVKSQRPSQKPHPSENLSDLSHPYVFAHLSNNLPTAISANQTAFYTEPKIGQPDFLPGPMVKDSTNISASQLSRGLTQVINSYMLVDQTWLNLLPKKLSTTPLRDLKMGETSKDWSLVSAETTHLTRVYRVSWPWMAACFASCGVLATCGIMGIILVHRGNSPEVLGFVSAIVRDSRYIKIPTDVDHMNGEDLSRMLKSERLRYGYTSFGTGGTPQMGIGREIEIRKVDG
ncbi:unnamed protein product [Clonostachys byssicola]|uniref:Uncharacterized protein n=1 Tax=Clonostachys byssicola TaxID=160290 RepID=A0A9N9U787_9HYPO|nr:unnamed protein product [Clonostachys byssicola]